MAGPRRQGLLSWHHVEYEVETPVGTLFVVDHGRKDPYLPGTAVAVTLSPERGVAIIPG